MKSIPANVDFPIDIKNSRRRSTYLYRVGEFNLRAQIVDTEDASRKKVLQNILRQTQETTSFYDDLVYTAEQLASCAH